MDRLKYTLRNIRSVGLTLKNETLRTSKFREIQSTGEHYYFLVTLTNATKREHAVDRLHIYTLIPASFSRVKLWFYVPAH